MCALPAIVIVAYAVQFEGAHDSCRVYATPLHPDYRRFSLPFPPIRSRHRLRHRRLSWNLHVVNPLSLSSAGWSAKRRCLLRRPNRPNKRGEA